MTPMNKFVSALLITGDILLFETTTGMVVSSIKTDLTNCTGFWVGHSNLEDEFKEEGKLNQHSNC